MRSRVGRVGSECETTLLDLDYFYFQAINLWGPGYSTNSLSKVNPKGKQPMKCRINAANTEKILSKE